MPTPQLIQFLLHQLASNDYDRAVFNKVTKDKGIYSTDHGVYGLNGHLIRNWDTQKAIVIELFIRTCLSQCMFKPVLSVFDGSTDKVLLQFTFVVVQQTIDISEYLYLTFDCFLRNGGTLDLGISTLHNEMRKLVPAYQEFLSTLTK